MPINDVMLKPAKRKILRSGITFFVFMFLMFMGSFSDQENFISVIGLILISVVTSVIAMFFSFLVWRKEFIYIEDQKITYEMTFFVKRKVGVPLENINVVELKRTFFDLLLGTTTIKIDSGKQVMSQSTELSLCFDKKFAAKYAEYLKDYSKALKDKQYFDEQKQYTLMADKEEVIQKEYTSNEVFTMSVRDKLRYAFINVSIMSTLVIFILMAIGLVLFYEWLQAELVILVSFFLILVGLFLFLTVLAFISIFIVYYKYTIKKQESGISIEYGLLSKKNLFVPFDKIHGYSLRSNIIQRVFHVSNIRLSVVGIDSEQGQNFLFLAAKKQQTEDILTSFLPEFKKDVKLTRSNKKSLIHTILIPLLWSLPFYIGLLILIRFFPKLTDTEINLDTESIIVVLMLIFLRMIRGFLTYKNAGLNVFDDVVVSSCGSVFRRYTVTKTSSVQEITRWQGFIRKKHDIASYYISYKGSSITGGNKVKNIPLIKLDKFK